MAKDRRRLAVKSFNYWKGFGFPIANPNPARGGDARFLFMAKLIIKQSPEFSNLLPG